MTAKEKGLLEKLATQITDLTTKLEQLMVDVSERLERIETAVVDLQTGATRGIVPGIGRLKNNGGSNGEEGP